MPLVAMVSPVRAAGRRELILAAVSGTQGSGGPCESADPPHSTATARQHRLPLLRQPPVTGHCIASPIPRRRMRSRMLRFARAKASCSSMRGAAAVLDHHLAVDEHGAGPAAAGEHRLVERVRAGIRFRRVGVGHHEVGALAGLQASGDRGESGGAGRVDGEHLQGSPPARASSPALAARSCAARVSSPNALPRALSLPSVTLTPRRRNSGIRNSTLPASPIARWGMGHHTIEHPRSETMSASSSVRGVHVHQGWSRRGARRASPGARCGNARAARSPPAWRLGS